MLSADCFPPDSIVANKYFKLYLKICQRQCVTGYTEKHHIVPRSFGGSNSKDNIVALSARAHYIAHVCLIRCTLGIYRRKAALAAHYMMSGCRKHKRAEAVSSRTYDIIRREFAKAQTGRNVTAETRAKIGSAHRGKTVSASAKSKMGAKLQKKDRFSSMMAATIRIT
jgi:HNH endonuclease